MSDNDAHLLIDKAADGSLGTHLKIVADISQDFAASLDINDTLQNSLRRIKDYLQAEAASIFLLENKYSELVCRACSGPVKITGTRISAGEGIVGKAIDEDRVLMVRDVTKDPNFTHSVDNKTGFSTRSILCAPLRVKEHRLGALELINKRTDDGLFNENDQHLLSALASAASLAIRNASMATALVGQERIQRELELAREIQRNLLPAMSPQDYPIHGLNISAREVSGDFYDYFELDDGRIYFNLADVSGKGVNAALFMAITSSLFHCLGKTMRRPGELLAKLNNELIESSTRGMFVTLVGGIFDPKTGEIVLANAGHQPPLYRDENRAYSEVQGQSPPLGILPDVEYPETRLNLNGGSLYLYTDGISEIRAQDGSQLEVSGLKAVISEVQLQPAATRLQAIVDILQKRFMPAHDDITLLLIERPS